MFIISAQSFRPIRSVPVVTNLIFGPCGLSPEVRVTRFLLRKVQIGQVTVRYCVPFVTLSELAVANTIAFQLRINLFGNPPFQEKPGGFQITSLETWVANILTAGSMDGLTGCAKVSITLSAFSIPRDVKLQYIYGISGDSKET